jgi:hypothetical protein
MYFSTKIIFMKVYSFLLLPLLALLLQCKGPATNSTSGTDSDTNSATEITENTQWWQDTTPDAATAFAGEIELDNYRTVRIDYERFFEVLLQAPAQDSANEDNRLKITLPLPNDETEEFAMHRVQVISPELAEKYPQIKTYEGRSTSDQTTSIRLDFGENGASYMIIKAGEQIFMEPVTQGDREIYIIYYKKDVKKHPVDFEEPRIESR